VSARRPEIAALVFQQRVYEVPDVTVRAEFRPFVAVARLDREAVGVPARGIRRPVLELGGREIARQEVLPFQKSGDPFGVGVFDCMIVSSSAPAS
jgi:hypothetical protein